MANELVSIADQIRVCLSKSDDYLVTAGAHLQAARKVCRETGVEFGQWCKEQKFGVTRQRILQIMGPDPIRTARQAENRTEETENDNSLVNEQDNTVEPRETHEEAEAGLDLTETVAVRDTKKVLRLLDTLSIEGLEQVAQRTQELLYLCRTEAIEPAPLSRSFLNERI